MMYVKTFSLLFLLSLRSPAILAQAGEAWQERGLPWPLGVQQRLDSMMRDPLLDTTQAGLMVWDLTEGRSLFAFNHRQLMRPASTMKLLTAITALDQLGGQHPFSTSLYYKGEISASGTLLGDIYCVGGMDPMFDYADMDSLVLAIRQAGIRRISGSVVADVSMKDTLRWGEGWCWDDDNFTLSPLLVGRKDNFLQVLMSKLARGGIDVGGARTSMGRLPRTATLITSRSHTLPSRASSRWAWMHPATGVR